MTKAVKNIGISEYREIIRQIQLIYKFNLSNYALTSLKRRIEDFMYMSSSLTSDIFIEKIGKNKDFFEEFLFNISVPTTEIFRDGEAWREFRTSILTKYNKQSKIKIWLPEATSGEELYSLLIVLYETEMLEKCEILTTAITDKNIFEIKSGSLVVRKLEVSSANYQRYKGTNQLSDYYNKKHKKATFNFNLLSKVEFKKHYIYEKTDPLNIFDIIIFRNRMLYYNKELQQTVLDNIYQSLSKGGHLFIGVRESLNSWKNSDKMKLIIKNENIFRKQK